MFRRRKRSLSDFADEIAAHLAIEADEVQAHGKQRSDAEQAAQRAFGNTALVREAFYENGRWLLWDQICRDLRHALRLLWRRPGFSAVVVLTLALGIGATSAIFGVIDAVLLRPLPYKNPDGLAMLWQEDAAHGLEEGRVSLLNFADWKTRSHSFEDLTIFCPQTFLLGGNDGPPERMRAARVTANFFSLAGVAPVRGRIFSADEEARSERVVVLSYRLWQSRFAGSAEAIGSDLIMDGQRWRIIGVMPETFRFPFDDTEVWEPVTAHPYWSRNRASPRSDSSWFVLGRMHSGGGWKDAQKEMSAVGHRLAAEHPESTIPPEIRVVPLPVQTTGKVRLSLAVLFGAVSMMLLIACINVANLLLARGSAREREFSVRRALGAGRGRLAAQLLIESLVLSVAGALPGLALAAAALKALIAFGPRDLPRLAEAHIDARVLLFTLALSLFTAIVSGLWPALRDGSTATRSRQWTTVAERNVRNVLVAGEFSLALVLLAGAGLMGRSYLRLQSVDPGFRPENLLTMRVDLHVGRTPEQYAAYFRDAVERVRRLPGVQSAAAVTDFLRSDPEDSVAIEGRAPEQPGPCEDAVEGRFFETAGIPLIRGRALSDLDRKGSPAVAVVNEAMVRRYWPDEEPIGKRFRFPGERTVNWITVVGVAGDMHRQGLERQVAPQVFRPLVQDSDDMLDIIVRTSVDTQSMAGTIRNTVQSIDTSVAKFSVATVESRMGEQTAERRFRTSLIGLFSLVSLVLSGVGIYGLMHYFVAQRSHEIGVRMALGARYGSVLGLVLTQGLKLAGVGLLFGIPVTLGLTRLVSSLLYDVKPADPATFLSAVAILLTVAVLACWIPARRAAHIDPVTVMRQD